MEYTVKVKGNTLTTEANSQSEADQIVIAYLKATNPGLTDVIVDAPAPGISVPDVSFETPGAAPIVDAAPVEPVPVPVQ